MSSAPIDVDYALLCTFPAAVPPNGVSNFEDPVSLKSKIDAFASLFTCVSFICVAGRLLANVRKYGLGDYMIILATAVNLGYFCLVVIQGRYYRHSWDIPVCWLDETWLKLWFCTVLLCCLCLAFGKIPILLLYCDVFAQANRAMRIAIHAGIVATASLYVIFIASLSYAQAPHIGGTWKGLLLSGQQEGAIPFGWMIGVGTIITDLYIFILPIPILVRLQLSVVKRLQLVALFGTASLGLVASIIGLAFRAPLLARDVGPDSFWYLARVNITNVVECNVVLSVACIPACTSLVRQMVRAGGIREYAKNTYGNNEPDSARSQRGVSSLPLSKTWSAMKPMQCQEDLELALMDSNKGALLPIHATHGHRPRVLSMSAIEDRSQGRQVAGGVTRPGNAFLQKHRSMLG